MMKCDRCGKQINFSAEGEEKAFRVKRYDACSHCANVYNTGQKKIDREIRELEDQRSLNWLNEWLHNCAES